MNLEKNNFDIGRAYLIYEDLKNITQATKQHCKDIGISYSEKYRHRLSRAINSGSFQEKDGSYVENVYEKESRFEEETSFNMPSAWDSENNKFLSLEEYCKKYGLPFENVKYGKLVSHNKSHISYNILFKEEVFSEENGFTEEFLTEVVKKNSTNLNVSIPQAEHSTYTTRVVYTDTDFQEQLIVEVFKRKMGLMWKMFTKKKIDLRKKLLLTCRQLGILKTINSYL